MAMRMRTHWRAVSGFILVAGGISLLGTGCSTIQRARQAQDASRAPRGERTVLAAEIGIGSNTVLTVEEAVRLALECHPSVVQARQELEAATAQAQSAVSAYWPGVDVSAGYSRRTSNTAGAPSGNHAGDSYSASVGLDVLIYDFGKTPATVRQACERRLAAEESLRAARNDVVYRARTAFFEVCRARELLQVAEESVRQFQTHLAQVRAFAEVGTRMRYDVTKAEVDVGNAQLARIDASGNLALARAALARAMGLAEEPGFGIQSGAPAPYRTTALEAMAVARGRHPELLALRARERAASAAVDAAIAGMYPSLRAGGEYGWGGARFPLTWNWSLFARAAASLFTGWRETARVDEAVAGLRAARANVAAREQQIYFELCGGLASLDTARERQALTELIVREAEESLALVGERYKVGKASAIEVTDAQVALTKARADQVKARFDHQTAVAQIQHAIGEGVP